MHDLLGYIISGFVTAGVITLLAHMKMFPAIAIIIHGNKS